MLREPRRPRFVVYPFAFGAFFVLGLAAQNGAALIRLDDLVRPLVITLLVCLAGWIISLRVLSSPGKAAILTTAWVVGFSTYGSVKEGLTGPALSEAATLYWVLLGWFLLALILLARALRRSTSDFAGHTRFLSFMALLLAGQAGARVVYALAVDWQPKPSGPVVHPTAVQRTRGETPDIYLIVLDKYTGSQLLAPNYGVDNSQFEAGLRDRGFVVPRASRTNYVQTFLSLASMLNVRYLDDFPERFGKNNRRWSAAYPLLEENTLAGFLQERGYRFVFFPTALPATARNRLADVQLPDPRQMKREFVVVWERTTLVPTLHQLWCDVRHCVTDRWPYVPESADFLDWKFQQLATVGGTDQPVFVLAHILLPHEPYLYRSDCAHRAPFWPQSDAGAFEPLVKAAYADQIRCVNSKMLVLVDSILRRSRTPPVILVLGDHGHGRLGRLVPPLESVSAERMRERTSIFVACHLPGVPPSEIGDSISPVNVTRLVLRHYFGADLPRVEDITYWSSWDRPYRFTRIP